MSTVKTYSVKLSGDKLLSKNFRVREFACHDGSDKVLICQETVDVLQAIRDYFGKKVTITSGYRTAAYNKKVGGASASQHVKGTAADIKVDGVPSWAVAGFLEDKYPIHGIGLYSTWVHVDSRGYGVKWKDRGSNVMGTFSIGKNYELYKAKDPEPVEEDEMMTDQQVYEAAMRHYKKLHEKILKESEWAKRGLQEAIDAGITDGSDPCAPIPRYQAAIMALRASKK